MDLEEADPGFQNEDQFWEALDKTLSKDCATHSDIDDTLRTYLGLVAGSKDQFEEASQLLAQCAYKLATSPLFSQNAEYIRRQFIHCLLQEDDADILLITASFLLADGQLTENVFELLNDEGAFSRLVTLTTDPSLDHVDSVRRLVMQMLYEMSRVQKISTDDLASVSDEFVECLFDLIEQVSGNVNDPYHYPVIRVLLVLNEQFMVAAHEPRTKEGGAPLTNKVVKVLSAQGNKYKTFGENIILLLNREDETSLQLLTLKLLYLLFTTPQTFEYFYTNDLRVLVDILIRNLLDLPEEATSLRHTYLRVLYPLLEHTQLQQPPHYKRNEILKLLTVLGGGHVIDRPDSPNDWSHFEEIDETTKRLVNRCKNVTWLLDAEVEEGSMSFSEEMSGPPSPTSPSKPLPPALPAPRKLKKRNSSKSSVTSLGQFLAPQLESARQSSLSMAEIATQREKPGVITPSRNASIKNNTSEATADGSEAAPSTSKPIKPPPPKARRSGWGRLKPQRTEQETESVLVVESPTEEKKDPAAEVETQESSHPEPEPPSMTQTELMETAKAKKPPPAPKARRWQFKRSKDSEIIIPTARESGREPGKFNASLPSIKTDGRTDELSPFSPIEEKTLNPTIGEGGADAPQRSVSEALEEAQERAAQSISDALEHTHIAAAPLQVNVMEIISEQPQTEITRPPRAVLAPPGPAPPRTVPGPQMELERSPFLSDAEVEGEDSDDEPS